MTCSLIYTSPAGDIMASRSKDCERLLGFPQPPWLLLGSALSFQVLASTHRVGELAVEWSSALLMGEPA